MIAKLMAELDKIQDAGGEWRIEPVTWDQREIYGRYRVWVRNRAVDGNGWGDDLAQAMAEALDRLALGIAAK